MLSQIFYTATGEIGAKREDPKPPQCPMLKLFLI